MASFLPSSSLLVTLLLVAFCCVASMVRAQADPRLEDDLFLRNLLLRRYFVDQQTPVLTIGRVPEAGADDQLQLVPEAAVSSFWRQRRTPAERAKLFRLSDQYTPTPCRWKLCASLFKAFRR